MSDSWKYKHIDDWSCKELQDWLISVKLGTKNQKKILASIADQGITGEDFNTMETKKDIMESFPEINAMSGNKIFAQLKKARKNKVEKKKDPPKKKVNSYNNAKNYPPEPKKKPQTWKAKHINSWSCQELQDWMGSIGLNAKDERRLQDAINMQGIEGEDFNSMETASDICESFEGISKNIGNKIYAELMKIRKMRRRNSNEKQYNKYKSKNNNNYNDNNNNNNNYKSFENDSGQYADTPYDYEAERQKNAQLASQYSDAPYQAPPPKYNNKYNNNNNNNKSYSTQAYVNPNSLQYKVNKIRQQYAELDDDTIKEVLARHNNNLNQTLRFIGMKKKQMEEEQKKKEVEEIAHMFGSLVSLAVVEEAGFVLAKPANRVEVIRRLTRVEPSGQTALRDAVVIGIAHMLKVKIALARIGALRHKFVHVVLTDGYDTASDSSFSELQEFFHKMGQELGDMCTTYFVGVGLDDEEKEELESISQIGGDSCELFNCDDVRIGDVFKRIAVSLGIRQEIVAVQHQGMIVATANEKLMVRVEEHQFLVLFTLDVSASMLDGRWDKVVAAVAGFMTGLKPTDIIGAIIFNEKCVIITDQ